MTERWNISSALRSGLGACNVASNGGSNGIGNNGASAGDGGGGTTFSAANGESGILRKTGHYYQHGGAPESFDDLLVFGYSCKVFRDDERARYIDQGRHLIPWMGDNQLKIDRYDARGALHDLAPYEPPPGGYQDRLEGLSAAEQKAEHLCEEERYYSLYTNEVEEELYQEESLKRQTMLGNQVPFNYDAPQLHEGAIVATVEDRAANSADEQDDDPFVLPKNFEVPPDITLPERMKEHAIIEKTAKFIASQDAQMEILLKTKQANNPQFEFLTQGTRLFRYYRHVLLAFRTNQYPADVEQLADDVNDITEKTGTNGATEQSTQAAQIRTKVVVPTIKYKPSVDCAYTQLISKITGAPIPMMVAADDAESHVEAPVNAQQLTSLSSEFDYYPEGSAPSTIVEVKKVSTGLAGLVQYNSASDGSDDETQDTHDQKKSDDSGQREKKVVPFEGVLPPLTVQHVIDRTAIYVAKNGYSFEEALCAKNDPRFLFLNRAHEYYTYYAYRVRQRMTSGGQEVSTAGSPSPTNVTIRTEKENGTVVETTPSLGIKAVHTAAPKVLAAPVTNIQHHKLGVPVSFSLVVRKAKEDGGTVKSMSGLGGSEDEEEEDDKQEAVATTDEVHNDRSRTAELRKNPSDDSGEHLAINASVAQQSESKQLPLSANSTTEDIASELLEEPVDATSPIVSADVLSVHSRSELEPVLSREKQAERKKRANMFVNLIKLQPKGTREEEPVDNAPAEKIFCGGKGPPAQASESDVDKESIHSVHSASPSPKKGQVKLASFSAPFTATSNSTTVIDDDDDDDDVVLVSETRPIPSRSRSRHVRSTSTNEEERPLKKKKSKSRHRSARGKKKAKKKSDSASRSPSRSRSDRSGSRRSRTRKRHSHSRSKHGRSYRSSGSSDNGGITRRSKRRSVSRHSSRSSRVKEITKRPKRIRSPSRSDLRHRSGIGGPPEVKRSSPTERKRRKEVDRWQEPSPTKKRTILSSSRSARRKSGSDTENRNRGQHRKRAADGNDGYDELYPPTRGRYWDC